MPAFMEVSIDLDFEMGSKVISAPNSRRVLQCCGSREAEECGGCTRLWEHEEISLLQYAVSIIHCVQMFSSTIVDVDQRRFLM